MNLESLNNEELNRSLQDLQRRVGEASADQLQALVQELQGHRIELEMHNRALRDAQTELERSVQRYADLYENLPVAYLTVTVAGLIRAANRMAHEWLQPDARGLVGQYVGRFVKPYDAGRLAAHLENCIQSDDAVAMEMSLHPQGARSMFVKVNARRAPRSVEDEPLVHLALTDITELKQTQQALQEINREQEAFNYSISHDLRAPLITINNYAGIVLSDYAGRLDEEGRAMIERIRTAGMRMESTLKHLLEYSTLAREDIKLGAVDTEQVIRELLIEHRVSIERSGAEVVVEKPIPRVLGCVPILNQVLANLLTNALKYTREGQRPSVRFSAEERESTVVLRVADRGIGIDPRHHERIFHVFERLHGYSKYPGSGVGLAIARRAVERMKGRIWVESAVDQGSCFCLELRKA